MNDIWNAKRKKLEEALVKAALGLAEHTGADRFTVPVPNTQPLLMVELKGLK